MFSLSESLLMCGMSAFQVWGTLSRLSLVDKSHDVALSCAEILQRTEPASAGVREGRLALDSGAAVKFVLATRSILLHIRRSIYLRCRDRGQELAQAQQETVARQRRT